MAGLTNPAFPCDSVVEAWQYVAEGLKCTLRTGHPGVTTMWTGSLGFFLRWLWDGRPIPLHDYVAAISTDPLDAGFIAPERLGTVLITSLFVVAVYWLARRLFGPSAALLGAVFLALDPFHIALSRVIHHDALSTTFMTLSVFCALIYWKNLHIRMKDEGGRMSEKHFILHPPAFILFKRGWLLLSGVCAGLAFLSKSASLFLMPFIALIGLWFAWEGGRQKAEGEEKIFILPPSSFILLIADGLLWFAVAMITVFVCWPAMWVAPYEAVTTVLSLGFKYSTGGHAKGNFLLGQIAQDPGPLFYPVTWLYRTTPLVMLGLIGLLVARVSEWASQRMGESANLAPSNPQPTEGTQGATFQPPTSTPPSSFTLPPSSFLLILLFILGYGAMLTLGEKKQERYLLPIYPWLDLLAGIGLMGIYDLRFTIYDFASRFPLLASRLTPHASCLILAALVLIVNGYLVAANFPYYFTYYNPLLGGIQGAAQAVTIGWGEGLDQAAAYLNQHEPPLPRVASWYESTFTPFYRGPSISYSKEKGKALAGDYVIFYINQTQRRFPDDIFFEYFEKRFKPEKVITLKGLDYAWIYPSLGIDHYVQDQTYVGIASLLAWQWTAGDKPLAPGQSTDFELYWEYLGKRANEPFFFRLVDTQNRVVAEGQSRPVTGQNPPPEVWRQGEILVERGSLTVPPGTPPGQYRLQIGFYTNAPAVTEGELLFTLPETESLITVDHSPPTAFTLPQNAIPVNQPLGDSLTLLGASVVPSATGTPPEMAISNLQSPISTDLYWRAEKAIPADFALHVGLMDAGGVVRQAWFDLSLAETFNPTDTVWQPGDIIHTSWQLDLLPETPPGRYSFDLILPASAGGSAKLSIGNLSLERPETR
ncbi:MAG: glycosyltransferase family 39 protein [Anaerolineae bacterium]